MLVVNTIEFFLEELEMEMVFSSQRREMLLFLTTNIAAVTSGANEQFERNYIITRDQKRDEHGASFQSSPKINRMLITRLTCIQRKFPTPDQFIASTSKFSLKYSLVPK